MPAGHRGGLRQKFPNTCQHQNRYGIVYKNPLKAYNSFKD